MSDAEIPSDDKFSPQKSLLPDDKDLLLSVRREAVSTMSPHRATSVMVLSDLAGLATNDPLYGEALYPYDRPAERPGLIRSQSKCGLTGEVPLRALGVPEEALYLSASYRSQRGGRLYPVSLEYAMAGDYKAFFQEETLRQKFAMGILPADILIMGCASCKGVWSVGTANFEHEATAIRVWARQSGESDVIVDSIDGGQMTGYGPPDALVRTRKILFAGPGKRELWAAAMGYEEGGPEGRPRKGRRILAIIDLDKFPRERSRAVYPEASRLSGTEAISRAMFRAVGEE